MNKYLISFADSKYHKTLTRIKLEARDLNFFNHVFVYNEFDLPLEFLKRHSEFIANNPRGYGYWIWKPQIVLQTLDYLKDDSLLLYVDGGTKLNRDGIPRLIQYFDMLSNSNKDFLFFNIEHHTINSYTKPSVIQYLNLPEHIQQSSMINANAFFVRNNENARRFISKWLTLCEQYTLINDQTVGIDKSTLPIHHRHDQSILSILAHLASNFITIPNETWFYPNWDEFKNFPIHHRKLLF